jgi:Protein of unknown function (DUF3892)
MIYITAVHMEPPGEHHGHIAEVKWEAQSSPQTGTSTVKEMVEWIGDKQGFAHVRDRAGNEVEVRVVHADPPYLRTYADGIPSDDLLAQPRY